MIAKITNFNGTIIWDKDKPDGTPRKLLCLENFNKLGWQSKITLKDGLKKTIKEYKIFHFIKIIEIKFMNKKYAKLA